ncbi:hypothetical protein DNK01_07580 [Stutzerimonas kirkiae]|nr:hypothetical protein DNK01_07580 [Stutzerimonas kirkiae]
MRMDRDFIRSPCTWSKLRYRLGHSYLILPSGMHIRESGTNLMRPVLHTAPEKAAFVLPVKGETSTLAGWVEAVEADPVARAIIESKPFQRLRSISFLGALDHVATTASLKKAPRTRANHSLHVAALAAFVAHRRGYDDDLARHLRTAGLLHDIGHPPLSHSVEPYLQKRFGYGHHEMGEMLIAGQQPIAIGLQKTLAKTLDITFVTDLIAGRVGASEGGDLFSSPINIDTIEGIIRSYRYLRDTPTALNPLQVAEASLVDRSESRFKVLDRFWELKDFIYNRLITQDIGLIADQYSQLYFAEGSQPLGEDELFDTEAQWQRRHPQLFSDLISINSVRDTPAALESATLQYSVRRYEIVAGSLDVQRYRCTKEPTQRTLAATRHGASQENVQLGLDFKVQWN